MMMIAKVLRVGDVQLADLLDSRLSIGKTSFARRTFWTQLA